jgi:hypothetical protein
LDIREIRLNMPLGIRVFIANHKALALLSARDNSNLFL